MVTKRKNVLIRINSDIKKEINLLRVGDESLTSCVNRIWIQRRPKPYIGENK